MIYGIAARLGVALTLVAAVSGGVTGYMTYRSSRERLVEEAQHRLVATATVAARRLSVTLEQAGREVLLMSRDPDALALLTANNRHDSAKWRGHYGDGLASHFLPMLELNPHFAEVRLIDRDEHGIERVRVARDDAQRPRRVPEVDLQEKGHLEYVSRGLSVPAGRARGSPLTLRRSGGVQEGLGEPTLIITAAVADAAGVTQGLVALNLRLDALFDDILSDLPPHHALYLTNDQGDYLLHPDPTKSFAFERGQQARVQDEFPEVSRLIQREGVPKPVLVHPGSGVDARLAVFIRKDVGSASSFVLGLAQPVEELMSASSALATRVMQVMLLFFAAALALAMLLARALTRPLRGMANAVQHFSESGEALPLPVSRNDEIGQLARAAAAAQQRITEAMKTLERQRAEMAHLARHDVLTGVANRLLFTERAELALARANRSGQMLAVLLIDLDDFKPVNDKYGHAAGDAVLVAVAQRMQALVRETDTVARLGGDEFAVLLEGLEVTASIESIVRKLREAIAQPVMWKGGTLHVGASIGVNVYPDGSTTLDALMTGADWAMYQAKSLRTGFAVFPAAMRGDA